MTLSLRIALLSAALVPGILYADIQPMSSAEVCGRCHQAIFDTWKQSAHAGAMESRLFQDALDATATTFGAASRKTCLSCHSPVTPYSGDTALIRKISWEGITCDYCHSIRSVSMEAAGPKAKVEFTLTKTGPRRDANPGAHAAEYSSVHTSSELCATCHEYRNANGFPVLTTFSEWKASRYGAENRTCQSCHMSSVAGQIVRTAQKADSKINLHAMPGSHSIPQLLKGVKVTFDLVRQKDQLVVNVHIVNQAGHKLPTGSPMRRLLLDVSMNSSGNVTRQQRAYERTVADRSGAIVRNEPAAFIASAKAVTDTRLAPEENRAEQFTFPLRAGAQANVKVDLSYFYSPMATTESGKRILFWTLSRMIY